jgi:copper chaperone
MTMAATHAVLNVPSVSCNHCKMAIEGAVKAIGGVDAVSVDIEAKSVTVDFESATVTLETIEAAVEEEGYAVAGRHVFGAD